MLLRRKCALRLENEWVAECTLSCVQLKYYVNTVKEGGSTEVPALDTAGAFTLNWNIFRRNSFFGGF